MAQLNYTPIQLYYSTVTTHVPSGTRLAYGELALNAADGKLYYKNSTTGNVTVLADGSIATGNLPGGSAGTVVYQSATGVTAYLPIGAANSLLYSTGSLPAYATLGSAGSIVYTNGTAPTSLAIGAQGSILYANGATPAYASIGSAGSLIYSNGTAPTALPIGTNTYVLVSNGSIPTYVNPASLSVGTAASATFATTAGSASTATTATTAANIVGGTTNQVLYQTGAGATSFVSAPSISGTVLGWNGSQITWVNAPAATTTTNIAGGLQYQIPYQSAPGSTTFSSSLTYNSSTNTFSTGNVAATGSVSATTSVSAGTSVSASTTVSAGTSITAGSSITATTSVTGATVTANGTITGSAATGAINYGTLNYSDTNIFSSYSTSVNNYAQKIIQNTSSGTSASVDFIVSNDQGTASTFYGDFGMNSSTYTGTGPFQAASIVYLYSISTDLVIGTKSSNYLRLVTNDNAADSLTISPTNAIAFNGNYGTSGQLLQSGGTAGAPVWVNSDQFGTSNGKLYFFGQF
jgi:hypothetical protein